MDQEHVAVVEVAVHEISALMIIGGDTYMHRIYQTRDMGCGEPLPPKTLSTRHSGALSWVPEGFMIRIVLFSIATLVLTTAVTTNAAPTGSALAASEEIAGAFESSYSSSSEDSSENACYWHYRCLTTEDEYPTRWSCQLECPDQRCPGVQRC